ncbi:MAG: hypothetical protein R6U57_00720 [Anaerolineales bacterium]
MSLSFVEEIKREGSGFIIWTILVVTIVALFVAGCGMTPGDQETPTEGERHPFTARAESEDGAFVAWSGYRDGFQPGGEEEFEVTIKNETDRPWHGRYCLQLMSGQSPLVLNTLKQHEFTLEPGMGYSDTVTVQIPETLDDGAYGLSMAVRRPGGPMVDMVPIKVGETEEEIDVISQRDMDASLEACPPVDGVDQLIEKAIADLAQTLEVSPDQVQVEDVESKDFPDASLGVPEPGMTYAQVITPGYVILLRAEGESYEYHAAGERVVLAEK